MYFVQKMEFIYFDQELDDNNNPTGLYRISTDKNREMSWDGHPYKFFMFYFIKVSVAQKIKTSLLEKIKKYRIEDKTVQDSFKLSLDQANKVRKMMDGYEKGQLLLVIQNSPSSDSGCGTLFIVAFVISLFYYTLNKDNFATTNQSNEESIAPLKCEGTIDASPLGSQFANLRSSPGEGSNGIKKLNNGTKIFFSGTSKGWVNIISDNGSEGWIASNLVKNKCKKLN